MRFLSWKLFNNATNLNSPVVNLIIFFMCNTYFSLDFVVKYDLLVLNRFHIHPDMKTAFEIGWKYWVNLIIVRKNIAFVF